MSEVETTCKPCPWCGEIPESVIGPDPCGQLCVICDNCGACGPSRSTHEKAFEAWDTLAPDPRIAAALEAWKGLE